MPISHSIYAPGVLYPNDFTSIYAPDDAYLQEVYIKNGLKVVKGDLIATMSSQELEIKIKITKGKLAETLALKLNAQKNIADLQPLDSRVKILEEKLEWYKQREKNLLIYAPISGSWVSKDLNRHKKSLLKKRELLGYIIPNNGFEFRAVVSQEKAFDLFRKSKTEGNIKLYNESIGHLFKHSTLGCTLHSRYDLSTCFCFFQKLLHNILHWIYTIGSIISQDYKSIEYLSKRKAY